MSTSTVCDVSCLLIILLPQWAWIPVYFPWLHWGCEFNSPSTPAFCPTPYPHHQIMGWFAQKVMLRGCGGRTPLNRIEKGAGPEKYSDCSLLFHTGRSLWFAPNSNGWLLTFKNALPMWQCFGSRSIQGSDYLSFFPLGFHLEVSQCPFPLYTHNYPRSISYLCLLVLGRSSPSCNVTSTDELQFVSREKEAVRSSFLCLF